MAQAVHNVLRQKRGQSDVLLDKKTEKRLPLPNRLVIRYVESYGNISQVAACLKVSWLPPFWCIVILFVYFLFCFHYSKKQLQSPCKMFPCSGKDCILFMKIYNTKIFLCIFWCCFLSFIHIY